MTVSLHLLTRFPPVGFAQLRADAEAEGYDHIERLANEWDDGSVRFQLDGEALFVALIADHLCGIGGLTHDPDLSPEEALRVRRLYVRPEYRRQGVGRVLLRRIIQHGLRHAPTLVANAGEPPAPAFFEASGFSPVEGSGHTHRLSREDDASGPG